MFENKQLLIAGQRGSGKTVFAKHIVKELFPKNHVVFDVNFSVNKYDWEGFNRFKVTEPLNKDELRKEFDTFFNDLEQKEINKRTHLFKDEMRVDCIVTEEANMVAPSRELPPFSFKFLTNIGRHTNVTHIILTRRPVQVNTDAVELADYLVLFALSGKNDVGYLNEIKSGLGDAVAELDFDKHDFIIWRRGAKEFSHFNKVAM